MTYDDALRLLSENGQEHILKFWNDLTAEEQAALLGQISSLDFHQIKRMQAMLGDVHSSDSASEVSPAPVIELEGEALSEARAAGENLLEAGRVGVILVAGGQGSRLGYDGPKGAFSIGPISGATLFEIHVRKVAALERKYGKSVHLYIMTSEANHESTLACFEAHDYFGISRDSVHFFVQGMWPALSEDGRIILDSPGHIFMSPDGHGGILSALAREGMISDMRARGIAVLYYFQVDNPLVDVADPAFIGLHSLNDADISLKVIAKRDANEGLGVVVERDGRHAMVEYTELTETQKHATREDGQLLFRYGSPAIHVFSLDFLEKEALSDLPLHVAHKKVPVCSEEGETVKPAEPNAYKFEKFVFDALPDADTVVNLVSRREDEFSPVKNAEGSDSPATAQADMSAKFGRWLNAAGASFPSNADGTPSVRIEIDPLFALNAEDLSERLDQGSAFEGDIHLR